MPRNALSQRQWNVISRFESVDECMPEHVTAKLKGPQVLVQNS